MNEKLRVVIVDDEATSRNVLTGYIHRYCESLEICGEAASAMEALKIIPTTKPDLVFLDVEMPGGNGFDLIDQLDDVAFSIIFVTAFDQYALKALNCGAAYYLLKPLSIDDLQAAVKKVQETLNPSLSKIQNRIVAEGRRKKDEKSGRVVLPLLDGFEVVLKSEILYCSAHDNFTDVFMKDGRKKMICRTLKFYEELLEEDGFIRVHKSHLINPLHVVKYSRSSGGVITMADGADLPLSPQRKEIFLSFFESGR
jgi:two-component system LytT family response regulator